MSAGQITPNLGDKKQQFITLLKSVGRQWGQVRAGGFSLFCDIGSWLETQGPRAGISQHGFPWGIPYRLRAEGLCPPRWPSHRAGSGHRSHTASPLPYSRLEQSQAPWDPGAGNRFYHLMGEPGSRRVCRTRNGTRAIFVKYRQPPPGRFWKNDKRCSPFSPSGWVHTDQPKSNKIKEHLKNQVEVQVINVISTIDLLLSVTTVEIIPSFTHSFLEYLSYDHHHTGPKDIQSSKIHKGVETGQRDIEYYLAIKKNEIWPLATTWMEPEGILLSEISQPEKDKYHDFTHVRTLRDKTDEHKGR